MTDPSSDDAEKFWRETWGIDRKCPVCGAPVNDEGCTVEIGHDSEPVPAEEFHAESQTGGWQVAE